MMTRRKMRKLRRAYNLVARARARHYGNGAWWQREFLSEHYTCDGGCTRKGDALRAARAIRNGTGWP